MRRFLAQHGTRSFSVGDHGRPSGWSALPKCVDYQKTRSDGDWAIDRIVGHMEQDAKQGFVGDFGWSWAVQAPPDATIEEMPQGIRHLHMDEERDRVVITGPNISVELSNIRPPRLAKDGVLIETQDNKVRALFLKDGHVAVEVFPVSHPTPRESAVIPQEASRNSDVADLPEEWRTPSPSAPQDTSETSSGHASETSVAVESKERQPRIKVTGFVATESNMKPTPACKPRVQFLVAEHPETPEGEDPQTVYHRVYTLNKTAERLQGKGIEKGKKVAVDGYVQERTRKGENGEEETYPVIYANTVRVLSVHQPVDY